MRKLFLAGALVVAGGTVGFYGPGMSKAPDSGLSDLGGKNAAQVSSASEDTNGDGTANGNDLGTAPGKGLTQSMMLTTQEVGAGWMPTGYSTNASRMCPLKQAALFTPDARYQQAWQNTNATTVITEILASYPTSDAIRVLDSVDKSGHDCKEWSDDSGVWSNTTTRSGDTVKLSLKGMVKGATVSIEARYQLKDQIVIAIMVASYQGAQAQLADQLLQKAANKA